MPEMTMEGLYWGKNFIEIHYQYSRYKIKFKLITYLVF
jgi:hypothetical protein